MTTFTCWGPCANRLGTVLTSSTVWVTGGRRHRQYEHIPSSQYRRSQSRVEVRVNHQGPTLGRLHHLEYDDGDLLAVATIELDRTDVAGDWYWSPTAIHDGYVVDMLELSAVRAPATIGLRPLAIVEGDLSNRFSLPDVLERASSQRDRTLLQFAAATARHSRHNIIEIRARADEPAPRIQTFEQESAAYAVREQLEYSRRVGRRVESRRGVGDIEYGPPGKVLSVR